MTVTMLHDIRDTIPHWHAAAIAAAENGINVLPALGKRPTASNGYKHLFRQKLTAAALKKWLSDPLVSRPSTGYLIMLGEISGNLCCRDFDEAKGYEIWSRKYPQQARDCPTVKTARGYHVYFRCEELTKTTQLDDGELRAGNSLVVGPGSKHDSGLIYAYIPNSPEIWNAPALSPAVFSVFDVPATMPLKPHQSPQVQSVRENRPKTRLDENSGFSGEAETSTETSEIFVPNNLLPTTPGTRHAKILKLVAWLKAQHPNITLEDSLHFFDRWWQLSFQHIKTKERWINEVDFSTAFRTCTGGRLGLAARVAAGTTPAERIEAMCRELARQSPDGVFFLSSRAAAGVAGCSPMQALRQLQYLTKIGIIRLVQRGTPGVPHGGRANEYQLLDR